MPERFKVVCMQGAIQVLGFTFTRPADAVDVKNTSYVFLFLSLFTF